MAFKPKKEFRILSRFGPVKILYDRVEITHFTYNTHLEFSHKPLLNLLKKYIRTQPCPVDSIKKAVQIENNWIYLSHKNHDIVVGNHSKDTDGNNTVIIVQVLREHVFDTKAELMVALLAGKLDKLATGGITLPVGYTQCTYPSTMGCCVISTSVGYRTTWGVQIRPQNTINITTDIV